MQQHNKRWQWWPAPTPTSSIFVEKFWKELPPKDMAIFLLAVFFTFSIIGYLMVLWDEEWYSWGQVALNVLLVGIVAVGYGYTSLTRRFKLLILIIILHISLVFVQTFMPPEPRSLPSNYLSVLGILIFLHMIMGYILFTIFISRVGDRIGRIRQELALGQKMHQTLVPPLQGNMSYFELFGRSFPAQEIGGDLMDAVSVPGRMTAYVADVSGHGVSAGLLMSAVKSAVRTALEDQPSLEMLLQRINPVVHAMKERTMFVTFAAVQFDLNRHLAEVVTVGHPPVIYYNRQQRTVHTVHTRQLPLGYGTQRNFQTRILHYNLGDIFLLFTDGLLESLQGGFTLLETGELASVLKAHSAESLERIYSQIMDTVQRKIKAIDDQTLLIIRCMG